MSLKWTSREILANVCKNVGCDNSVPFEKFFELKFGKFEKHFNFFLRFFQLQDRVGIKLRNLPESIGVFFIGRCSKVYRILWFFIRRARVKNRLDPRLGDSKLSMSFWSADFSWITISTLSRPACISNGNIIWNFDFEPSTKALVMTGISHFRVRFSLCYMDDNNLWKPCKSLIFSPLPDEKFEMNFRKTKRFGVRSYFPASLPPPANFPLFHIQIFAQNLFSICVKFRVKDIRVATMS